MLLNHNINLLPDCACAMNNSIQPFVRRNVTQNSINGRATLPDKNFFLLENNVHQQQQQHHQQQQQHSQPECNGMPSFFINGRAINNIEDLEEEEGEEDDEDDEEEEMEEDGYEEDNYLGHQMNNNNNNNNLNRMIGMDYLGDINAWNNSKNIMSTTKNKGNKRGANSRAEKSALKHPMDRKGASRQVASKQKKTAKEMEASSSSSGYAAFDPASFLDLCFNTSHLENNLSNFSAEGITNDMVVTNVPAEQQFNKQLAKGSQRSGQAQHQQVISAPKSLSMSNNSHNHSSSIQNGKDKQSLLPTSGHSHSVSMSTLSDSVRAATKKSTTNSNRVQQHHHHQQQQQQPPPVNGKAEAVGSGPYKQTLGGIDLNQQLKAANLNTIINNLSQQQSNINFAIASNHNDQQQQQHQQHQQHTNHSDKSTNNNSNHDNVFIKNNHLGKEFSSNSTTALLGNNFLNGAHQLLANNIILCGTSTPTISLANIEPQTTTKLSTSQLLSLGATPSTSVANLALPSSSNNANLFFSTPNYVSTSEESSQHQQHNQQQQQQQSSQIFYNTLSGRLLYTTTPTNMTRPMTSTGQSHLDTTTSQSNETTTLNPSFPTLITTNGQQLILDMSNIVSNNSNNNNNNNMQTSQHLSDFGTNRDDSNNLNLLFNNYGNNITQLMNNTIYNNGNNTVYSPMNVVECELGELDTTAGTSQYPSGTQTKRILASDNGTIYGALFEPNRTTIEQQLRAFQAPIHSETGNTKTKKQRNK